MKKLLGSLIIAVIAFGVCSVYAQETEELKEEDARMETLEESIEYGIVAPARDNCDDSVSSIIKCPLNRM